MTAPESGTAAPPAPRPAPRHGPADPVKILMHRHRTLCERAVDPLEIAAGLEAHGVTDRAAARFRHRDVFSLAEELYARVPRADEPERAAAEEPGADPPPVAPAPAPLSRVARAAVQLLPGAIGLATVAAHASVRTPTGHVLTAVDATGLLLTVLAVRLALRHGPLRLRRGPGSRAAVLWAAWAVGYAVYGDWLLTQLLSGGPDVPGPHPRAAVAAAVALACALAPAAGCAHWFAVRARRGLATSRALSELASRVRPLLVGATLLFLVAAAALALGARLLLAGAGSPGGRTAVAAVCALAVLLFLARLLSVHGFPTAAAAGLGTAAALEAAAPALVLAARLPGLARLGTPVEVLVRAAGPAAVPAVAGAVAALGLLVHGLRALTGACAHPPSPEPDRRGGTPATDPAEDRRS
ncbi:hypothetical protein [Streptomyces sp. NPDC059122]|uniref:hypothetical protein n=1 Tax=Streptomyces sp. NPDC059122 TaxID=3346732 RepID=UPI0036831DA2